ncbi:MAG: glucose-1-phosphate adenylyltransferase subunit GlgD [Bacillota bacterium]|nr:glucose-1-phosphate adenylyltransferase subunit GlgD [Bacillota bacterium]
MRDVMGVININIRDDVLDELTFSRCISSVHFGGHYRLIDFILSSMVNSGIQHAAVFTLQKYRSLVDHLGTGKEWDLNLNSKDEGLSVLHPNLFHSLKYFQGDLQNFYSNMDFFKRSRQKNVLIAGSNMVCNLDFRELVDFHRRSKADITFLYRENDPLLDVSLWRRRLVIGEDGRILSLEPSEKGVDSKQVLLEIFVMSKTLLIDLVENCVINGTGDLLHDGIIKNSNSLKLFAFPAKGYLGVINSPALYYKHSMNLLNPSIRKELFSQPGLIYTKDKDLPPTKYMRSAEVTGSLLASGCSIEGRVENSILFRETRVEKGAYIKDSIILPKCQIAEGAQIEHAIIGKGVSISMRKEIKGRKDNLSVIADRTIM